MNHEFISNQADTHSCHRVLLRHTVLFGGSFPDQRYGCLQLLVNTNQDPRQDCLLLLQAHKYAAGGNSEVHLHHSFVLRLL